jgi:DNA-binding Lrp family transcriptional regulator
MFDVFVLLRELSEKPQSFSDIARKYGVSRQYVSKVAKPLLEAGIIKPCEQGYRISEEGAVFLSILTQTFNGLLFAIGFDKLFVENYLRWREEKDNSIKSMSREEINKYYATRSLYAHFFYYLYIYIMLTVLMQAYAYTKARRITSEKSLNALLEELWKDLIKPLIKSMLKVLKKYDILEYIELTSLYLQILSIIEKDLQTIDLLTSEIDIVKELLTKALLALEGYETIRSIVAIPEKHLRILGLLALKEIGIIEEKQEAQSSKQV